MNQALLLGLLAVLSELLGTVGGFGSSMFFVPLAQAVLSFHLVLALTGILHVFGNVNKIVLFYREINWKIAVWFLLPTFVMVIIGSLLTNAFSPHYLEVAMGVFLVLFSGLMFFKPHFVLPAKKIYAIGGGGLSGFLTGLLGSGGAIRGITMAAFQLDKSTFIATNALIDFVNDSTRTVIYLNKGYLTPAYFYIVPVLFVSALLGSYLGKRIVNRISQDQFQKIVLILVAGIGFWMIWEHKVLLGWSPA